MLSLFVHTYFKMLVIYSPFFVVSFFLAMTKDLGSRVKRAIIIKAIVAAALFSFGMLFFGKIVLQVFGVTLEAFRIGAGAILFLSGLHMVQGEHTHKTTEEDPSDLSIVPLAVPVIVGPSVTGMLLVLGADLQGALYSAVVSIALFLVLLTMLFCLFLSETIERVFKEQGIKVLIKLSGLMIASLAAQMIFTGIRSFIK
jgi:multiple antibiotic resistance protein